MEDDYHPGPLLVEWYEQYLVDQDVTAFVRLTSRRYFVGTLQRLALEGHRSARRAAILALGRLADYTSNNIVGCALADSDRGVRTLAEQAICRLWMRVGTATDQRMLVAIEEQLDEREYDRTAKLAADLIQQSPWISQAWYQRGAAYYQLGQFEAAIRDCNQALEINAYHFQAASIMGHAYLSQGSLLSALEAFRRTLRLNPSMEEVRAQVIRLQRTLKQDNPE